MAAEEGQRGEGHDISKSPLLDSAPNLSNLGLTRAAFTASPLTTVRAYAPWVGVRGTLVGVRGEESAKAK